MKADNMNVQIYHKKNTDFRAVVNNSDNNELNMNNYVLVAEYDSDVVKSNNDNLYEDAYHITQNIDSSWSKNLDPNNNDQRSTSVGDLIVVNGKPKEVSGIGFSDITLIKKPKITP